MGSIKPSRPDPGAAVAVASACTLLHKPQPCSTSAKVVNKGAAEPQLGVDGQPGSRWGLWAECRPSGDTDALTGPFQALFLKLSLQDSSILPGMAGGCGNCLSRFI